MEGGMSFNQQMLLDYKMIDSFLRWHFTLHKAEIYNQNYESSWLYSNLQPMDSKL
jgi:hypothetical protein